MKLRYSDAALCVSSSQPASGRLPTSSGRLWDASLVPWDAFIWDALPSNRKSKIHWDASLGRFHFCEPSVNTALGRWDALFTLVAHKEYSSIPFNELNRVLDLGFKPFPWGDTPFLQATYNSLLASSSSSSSLALVLAPRRPEATTSL